MTFAVFEKKFYKCHLCSISKTNTKNGHSQHFEQWYPASNAISTLLLY